MKKILILILLYFINCKKEVINQTVGGEFDIVLEGNPKTGFKWYLANIKELLKERIIIPRGISNSGIGRYKPLSKPHKGNIGIFIFGFKANKESQKPVICKFVLKNSSNKIKEVKDEKIYNMKISNWK